MLHFASDCLKRHGKLIMTNEDMIGGITTRQVALGVTGGIAAYKAVEILRELQKANCRVRICMTPRACEFIRPLTFRAISGEHVVTDDYAPENPDPIAHITFSQTADLLVVAPATANVIAKFANGIADDFLTSTYLASTAPVLVAPAMNTTMWQHPATVRNLERLRADGVRIIEPEEGIMACGTTGPGRLADPQLIVRVALEILNKLDGARDLSGERFLITAGATREAIDPVRFLSNRSSGRMGFALAEAALARGAEVTVVAGVTTAAEPSSARVLRATSAEEMRAAVMREIENATVFIGAAAVADYRPVNVALEKIKKTDEPLTLTLEPTPDVLLEVARARRAGLLVVGFAAETSDVVRHAREKLERKNLDCVIANDVTSDGAGFDVDTNIITILKRGTTSPVTLPLMSKLKAADRILDEIASLRARRPAKQVV